MSDENEEVQNIGTRIDLPSDYDPTGIAHIRVGSLVQSPSPETIMDLIRQSPLFDEAEFEGETPFDWTARASNTEVDAYFTHMMESTLKNYATDASASVPFQHAHDGHSAPIGRSLVGEYTGGKAPATTILFYTFPGLRSKDMTTDEFRRGVKAGIYRDVSVGFFGGDYICDICQRDLMTYECNHYPGMKYPVDEGAASRGKKGGKSKEMVVATAGIDNAHLAEVSTVYRGATPGAVILKARSMAMAGELRPEVAGLLEARYRIALPRQPMMFRGIELNSSQLVGENNVESIKEPEMQVEEINQTDERALEAPTEPEVRMTDENKETTAPEVVVQERVVEKIVEREVPAKPVRAFDLVPEEVRADLASYGVAEDMDAARAVGALLTHIRALTPQAEDGKSYREYLIDEGVKAVVRAYGEGVADVDRYRVVLSQQSVDTIRAMTADWEKMSGNDLKAGRLTVEGEETAKAPKPTREAPSRLYAV